MKEIQVAVWGLGPHAIKNIVPAIKICPGMNLYGVCSRDAGVVSDIREKYSCTGWDDPAKMLGDPNVDVIYLSTPIGLHYEQGKTIMLASKHFWCEKPLALDLNQTMELLELAKRQKVTIAKGFMYLYHPQFLYLQEILKSGRLGKINNINCRFGIPPLTRPGFRNNPDLGGGAFLDVGSYPISAISSLFSDADINVNFSKIKTAEGSPVDTTGRAVLSLSDDTCVTLEWSINSSYRNEVDIWGSEGSVYTSRIFSKPSDYSPSFDFSNLQGVESREPAEPANHFLEMFKAFRDLITDSKKAEKESVMILRRAELINKIRIAALGADRNT